MGRRSPPLSANRRGEVKKQTTVGDKSFLFAVLALSFHLDAFELGAGRGLGWGGYRSSSSSRGHVVALGCLGARGQREGEGGEEGGGLTQEAVHGFILLHGPL